MIIMMIMMVMIVITIYDNRGWSKNGRSDSSSGSGGGGVVVVVVVAAAAAAVTTTAAAAGNFIDRRCPTVAARQDDPLARTTLHSRRHLEFDLDAAAGGLGARLASLAQLLETRRLRREIVSVWP